MVGPTMAKSPWMVETIEPTTQNMISSVWLDLVLLSPYYAQH